MLEQFLNQLAGTSWVEWLGMVTGILGVWLSIKEKVAAWIFFIICYSCYVYISYHANLHAFMGMNIVFIGISFYGWTKWAKPSQSDADKLPIRRTTLAHWPLIGLFIVLTTSGIGWLLDRNGESSLPYLDTFAVSCGFTAQWMLSRKRIETWIFWIITDLIYLGMFLSSQSWPSVILFTVFIGLAIKGWKEWQNSVSDHE